MKGKNGSQSQLIVNELMTKPEPLAIDSVKRHFGPTFLEPMQGQNLIHFGGSLCSALFSGFGTRALSQYVLSCIWARLARRACPEEYVISRLRCHAWRATQWLRVQL